MNRHPSGKDKLKQDGLPTSDDPGHDDIARRDQASADAGFYGICPITGDYNPPPRIQDAMSRVLIECGRPVEAKLILGTSGKGVLRAYAWIVAEHYPNTNPNRRAQVLKALKDLGLL